MLPQVNETLAALMLLPVAAPVGCVVPAPVRQRGNLVHAMIAGQKRAPARRRRLTLLPDQLSLWSGRPRPFPVGLLSS